MAMKCPDCGADNPEDKIYCGDCGGKIPQRVPPEAAPITSSAPKLYHGRSRVLAVVVVIVVALIVVVASLAYYYQPVRGTGAASSTTVVRGGSVQFDFVPSSGIGPYAYHWTFGDGSSSQTQDPTHAYTNTGTYTVTVTVTGKAGMKCSWTTIITVRTPLVFIDQVSYPSMVAYYPLGDTYCKLFVDGRQVVFRTASLQPGTNHSIELQIIGVLDLSAWGIPGGGRQETTLLDETGTVTAPTTETDLHCVLQYDPLHYAPAGRPTFTLVAL